MFHCLYVVAKTAYGIEVFEYYKLKPYRVEYTPETDVVSFVKEVFLVQKDSIDAIPRTLDLWIKMYHREKLAKIAGLDPEQMEETTPSTHPKM